MNNKKDKLKLLSLLQSLKKMSPDAAKTVINHLSDDSVDSLCECVYNVINVDLKLNKRLKQKLIRHIQKKCSTHRLKCIMNKKQHISKRRKALSMEGGFGGLGLLLSTAIPFLTSLFTKK
jgi:uncharacterized membrane protein